MPSKQKQHDAHTIMSLAVAYATAPDTRKGAAYHALEQSVQRALQRDTPASLVRAGLESTPAMQDAEHALSMNLVRRASERIRHLNGALREAQQAMELATKVIDTQRADLNALQDELARAEAMLAMAEDQPLAAIHGTAAANQDSLQAAA